MGYETAAGSGAESVPFLLVGSLVRSSQTWRTRAGVCGQTSGGRLLPRRVLRRAHSARSEALTDVLCGDDAAGGCG